MIEISMHKQEQKMNEKKEQERNKDQIGEVTTNQKIAESVR
jgi:hypothetical protein